MAVTNSPIPHRPGSTSLKLFPSISETDPCGIVFCTGAIFCEVRYMINHISSALSTWKLITRFTAQNNIKCFSLSPSSQYVTLPKTPCFSAISLYVLFLACLLLPQWHHLAIYPIFSSFAFQEDSSLWISPETWPSEWIRCQHGWGNYSCPCRNLDANRILCNATPAWNPCAMLTGKWNSF